MKLSHKRKLAHKKGIPQRRYLARQHDRFIRQVRHMKWATERHKRQLGAALMRALRPMVLEAAVHAACAPLPLFLPEHRIIEPLARCHRLEIAVRVGLECQRLERAHRARQVAEKPESWWQRTKRTVKSWWKGEKSTLNPAM